MGTYDTADAEGRRKDPRAPCQASWRGIAGPVRGAVLGDGGRHGHVRSSSKRRTSVTASVIMASICTLSLTADWPGQVTGRDPGSLARNPAAVCLAEGTRPQARVPMHCALVAEISRWQHAPLAPGPTEQADFGQSASPMLATPCPYHGPVSFRSWCC